MAWCGTPTSARPGPRQCGAALRTTDTVLVADDAVTEYRPHPHCGLTNQTENCQFMPMLTYAVTARHPATSADVASSDQKPL